MLICKRARFSPTKFPSRAQINFAPALVTLAFVAACSGQGSGGQQSVLPSSHFLATPQIGPSDFMWVKAKAQQVATATCPQGWTVIGGGANSTDAGDVGTGQRSANGWVVTGGPSETVVAWASCVVTSDSGYFIWEGPAHLGPGQKVTEAYCPSGDILVTGYANGEDFEAGNYRGTNGWIAGVYGVGSVSACAACALSDVGLELVNTWGGTGIVFSPCPADKPQVIGGSMGDDLPSSFWPGPPAYSYPQLTSGKNGWKASSGQANVLSRAICAI